MFIQIYDQNIKQIGVIDEFISLIWTKRYNDVGDFQVEIPLEGNIPEWIRTGNYVTLSDDLEPGYYMIIETLEIEQEEGGNILTISGRSLESILERRIVWDKLTYTLTKTELINKDLLEKSFIKPSLSDRKVPNFVYKDPDESLSFSQITAEYDGDSILDAIRNNCNENNHSMSVRYLNDQFVYQTYTGTNRSHDQTEVDEVLFSYDFDTLASSKYLESIKNYKNVIQVVNSNGSKFSLGNVSGISRIEYRENASNATDQESLKAIASIVLSENNKIIILEGTTINDTYIYGIDIFVGDFIQFRNDYGIESKARITEYVYSEDTSGINKYPTFKVIKTEGGL